MITKSLPPITPGWKTSEFRLVLVASIVAVLNSAFGWHLDASTLQNIALVIGAYVVSRGVAKHGANDSKAPVADTVNIGSAQTVNATAASTPATRSYLDRTPFDPAAQQRELVNQGIIQGRDVPPSIVAPSVEVGVESE